MAADAAEAWTDKQVDALFDLFDHTEEPSDDIPAVIV
jgi:hypothetical protein